MLRELYGRSLALLTDLYQLTMACGYWRRGMAGHEAVFHLTFRRSPFGGAYAVACGLVEAAEFLERLRFEQDDLAYLASLTGADERPLFEPEFLAYLGELRFDCDLDAVEEGEVVFPHEPLLRVRGPLIAAQLVETPLLTIVNFSTLVATKATRVCRAARGAPVIEFGLRRAQGIDGGLTASRASFVGGCVATSNVLAGRLFGIPVRGTHAHSWVMAFEDELEAFRAYAAAQPNNALLLVDTYDTLEGVRRAAQVGRELAGRGRLLGVRLDSGDLASLSRGAREILDEAGLTDAQIVASSDLDEYEIERLRAAGARIDIWGVGTRLATCYDQPALGGVYKLSAIREGAHVPWSPRLKLSEQPIKVSTPGIQQVRRFERDGRATGDMIVDESTPAGTPARVHSLDGDRIWAPAGEPRELLVPVLRRGARVGAAPGADGTARSRDRAATRLAAFSDEVLAPRDAAEYPVGLESSLFALKARLMAEKSSEARG